MRETITKCFLFEILKHFEKNRSNNKRLNQKKIKKEIKYVIKIVKNLRCTICQLCNFARNVTKYFQINKT